MSGDKKKRTSKAQGWEEAKDEFYQETYPTDGDLDAVERDPKKIATLLPSKQTRGTIATRRLHKKEKGTVKRRTSNRSATNTMRRQSINQDMSMLPDLSENHPDEQTTWEEIMMIKTMPISLSQKKEMKARLNNATTLRLQGYEQFKWKRRKMVQEFRIKWEEIYTKFELWKESLKKIEGHYGTGVVTFFQFIKWLIFLNAFLFLLMFLFVILPAVTLTKSSDICLAANVTTPSCLANHTDQDVNSTLGDVLAIIQGTGWMEDTYMFFGKYECAVLQMPQTDYYYNLPFAYILVTISIFILSLVCIVKSAARGFRERLLEGEGQHYQFCNLVFGGWDFCIQNDKSAEMKHQALYNEIKSHLTEDRLKEEAKQRTREAAVRLWFIRMSVHLLVLLLLAGSAGLIYFTLIVSKEELDKLEGSTDDEVTLTLMRLLFEYIPSITIVALNTAIPIILKYFVRFEKYSPIMLVRRTMLRTIFLRLAALVVLIVTLSTLVDCQCKNCTQLRCWETYVGQNFYKLVLVDFVTHVLLTFFVNFPRMLIGNHCGGRFAKLIGEQEFDLPKHVLDIVYTQTVCWLGLYFAPILPAIVCIKLVIIFYIKKFACLVNSKPSSSVHLASRSKSMFMAILLVGFVVGVTPVAISIGEVTPSSLCGPFRGHKFVWDVVLAAFATIPKNLQDFIYYLGTAGFAVPAFIALGFALYYFYAVSQANKHMVSVLKSQLVLEGHDKQFLLGRLSMLVKQQQEQGRRLARSIPPPNSDVSSVPDRSNAS